MPRRIVGLEVSESEIRATVVEAGFRDYRVSGSWKEPVAPEQPLGEQLGQFLERHELTGEPFSSVLPAGSVTWRFLSLPFRDRKRLAQTVPFELENHVPFDLDDVVLDYQVLQRESAGTAVLAGVVPKAELERHLALFEGSGVEPEWVDLAPLAALNVLSLVSDLPRDFAFVDLGPTGVTVGLYAAGRPVGLRSLLPASVASGSNGTVDAAHARDHAAVQRMVADVRWTLLALAGGSLGPDLPVYLAGDPSDLDLFAPALQTSLGLEVRRLDQLPLAHVGAEGAPEAAGFSRSLGLALREVSGGTAFGLNFRQGPYAYHRSQHDLQRRMRGVASLAALVVALTVTDIYLEYRQQVSRLDVIEAQIRDVAGQTLPDLAPSGNPLSQLQVEIDDLQQRLDVLNSVVPVSSSTTLDLLQAISTAIPSTIRVESDDFVMDADAVRVRGNSDSFESVDVIKQKLMATGYFSDIQVRDARAAKDGKGVDFRLTMVLSKDVRVAGEQP